MFNRENLPPFTAICNSSIIISFYKNARLLKRRQSIIFQYASKKYYL